MATGILNLLDFFFPFFSDCCHAGSLLSPFLCLQALSELSESPEVITQKPSFIVFMEGGDKEEQVGLS